MTVRRAAGAGLLLAVLAVGGCGGGEDPTAAPSAEPPSSTVSTSEPPSGEPPTSAVPTSAVPTSEVPGGLDTALRDELLLMLERDQGRRLDTAPSETREDREARLAEIFDEHGWPGFDLVGRRAGTAAWAIAQHADLDLAFQERALGLLRRAVAADQASPGNLAYLEDRVAVATGRPQTYGTQIGCTPAGPKPSTPIKDRPGLGARRQAAGLDPIADYYDEMAAICAQDG